MALSTADQVPLVGFRLADGVRGDDAVNERIGIGEHLTIAEATELLDWLEGHGIRAKDVSLDTDGLLTVRWGG